MAESREGGDHTRDGNHYDDTESFRTLAECDQALEIDPLNADAWNTKGRFLLEMGRITDASECFARATRLYLGQNPAPG